MALWTIPIMIVDCWVAAFASLVLKRGAENLTRNPWDVIRNYNLIAGLVLYVIGAATYFTLLRFYQLSVLYAIGALTYVFSAFLAYRFLGETISKQKKIGIGLIVLGVTVVGVFGGG